MLCQQDSYKKECREHVLSCIHTEVGWEVETTSSLLYPMGGGQPSDHGWIGNISVVDVQKRGGNHIYITNEKVEIGEYYVRLDWKRRFDFMQQHTGQHLLTSLILNTFGWMTVGFHIGPEVSTIDLDTSNITVEQREKIVAMVNEAILAQLEVRAIEVTREEFAVMDIRSRGVPEWVEGPIRLIEIENVDINNCGGTHVRNTSELQMFSIVGMERMKKKTRLSFVYGGRLLALFQNFLVNRAQLNDIFQSGEHVVRAQAWAVERKEHKKLRKQWNEYRARQEGERLANNSADVIVEYLSGMDLGMLKGITRDTMEKCPSKSIFLYSEEVFVLYSSCESSYQHVMNVVRDVGGRGGGRLPNAQGKWQKEIEREALQIKVTALLRGNQSQ